LPFSSRIYVIIEKSSEGFFRIWVENSYIEQSEGSMLDFFAGVSVFGWHTKGIFMKKPLLFVVTVLLALANCGKVEEGPAPSDSHKNFPEQESWDSEIILSESGRTTAIVKAKHLKKFQQTLEIDGGLRVDFFNQDGSHSSVLTAEKGIIDRRTDDLKAMGNVVLVSDEGSQLRTEQLRWDNRRGKVLAEGEVTISTEQITETGTGFEAYPDLKRWSMRQVTGRSKERLKTPGE